MNATSKLVKAWESKNARNAARAGGISMMALSLAACGGSSTTTTTTSTGTTTTTTSPEYLTSADNVITGTAGADTVNAVYKNSGSADTGTLNLSDSINGGDGSDTVNITAYDEITAALAPVLNSFETVTITNALSGIGAHAGVSTWAADATNIQIKGAQATELNDLAYATQTVTMNATSGDIVLDGVGTEATVNVAGSTGGELSVETATSATLNVTADSTIDDITSGGHDAATLTITGSGALTLSAVADASVTTINAADNTGGVSISGLDFANIVSVTGTAANDTFGTTTSIVATDVIAGGDGDDTLVISSNITAATLVTGIETVEMDTASLTYEMEVDGATAIVVAAPGADSAGATDDDIDITGYDGSASITISDKNIVDDTEAETINLDVAVAADYTSATTISIVTTQDGGTSSQAFIVEDIDIDDETGGDSIEEFTINVSGTRAVTIENIDLAEHSTTATLNVNSSVALVVEDIDVNTITAADDLGHTFNFAGSTGAITLDIKNDDYDSDDVITGGSGADTLVIATLGNYTIDPTITGFETLTIEDSAHDSATVDLSNASGVTTITLDAVSTKDITITNIASGTAVTVTAEGDETASINAAAAGASVSVTYEDVDEYDGGDTLAFGANVSTVSVAVDEDDTDVDEIDMTFAGNITLNITGDDSTDDVLALVLDQAATTTSVAINSTAVISYDASSDALDDDITVTFAGSTGAVSFTVAGDDLAVADTTLVGGSGSSDTLVTTLAAQSTAATVSGFETLSILDANGATVDLDDYTGVTTISLVDVDAGTLALNNVNGEAIDINTGIGDGSAIITVDSDTDGGGSLTLTMTASIADIDNEIIVTDFATLAFEADEDQDALYFDLDDDDLDTATFTGDSDIVMSTSGDMDVFETINIFNAGNFNTNDTGNAAADTNFNLHSDNVDVDLDLAAGSKQTITLGSTLDSGDVITITGFLEGSGVAADVLDLSALGLSGVGDLTFTDSDEDSNSVGNDSVTITSTEFAGSIVLIGTDADTVLAANLSAGDNFIF
jgi:hypothetical protein